MTGGLFIDTIVRGWVYCPVNEAFRQGWQNENY